MARPVIKTYNLMRMENIMYYDSYLPNAFDESMTILEKMNKLIEYLNQMGLLVNDVVTMWNEVAEWIMNEGLEEAMTTVLNKMVESGKLAHIVNQLIFKTHVYTYKTVADMKKDTGLIAGDMVATLGYYDVLDGGGASYIIEESSSFDSGNPQLENKLVARLIHKGVVNANQYGASKDKDDNNININEALKNVGKVELLPIEYKVKDSVIVSSYQSLTGVNENIREQGKVSKLTYVGDRNNRKAVVLLGRNIVDAEPVNDSSNVVFKNVYVDANNLAGFGVYGTYITNQSIYENVAIRNSLEYNSYIAKSWYARYSNIYSLSCRNNGLAFGMPLEYLDGININWVSPSSLEMNNTAIKNIQSQRAGTFFADEKAVEWLPTNLLYRRKGYGVGIGVGNMMIAEGITSEKSGGVNLYDYSGAQPGRKISNCYLEKAQEGSGKTGVNVTGIIIESIIGVGSSIVLSDIFTNYNNGGGIYVTGTLGTRRLRLSNIHQPRFLRPIDLTDAQTSQELSYFTIKSNVYGDAGTYDMDMSRNNLDLVKKTNPRYSFENGNLLEFNYQDTSKAIYVRNIPRSDGTFIQPYGALAVVNNDGTKTVINFPSNLRDTWVLAGTSTKKGIGLEKAGFSGDIDTEYEIKVFSLVPTYY